MNNFGETTAMVQILSLQEFLLHPHLSEITIYYNMKNFVIKVQSESIS